MGVTTLPPAHSGACRAVMLGGREPARWVAGAARGEERVEEVTVPVSRQSARPPFGLRASVAIPSRQANGAPGLPLRHDQ